jgi:hypothetical protein
MSKVRSLQTKGVFCCYCDIFEAVISCELLATFGTQEELSSLLDPDTGVRYTAKIPPGKNILWSYTMERVNATIR